MKTLDQLINEIQFGELTNTDLNRLTEAINWRKACLARHNVWNLKVGDRVTFTSNKGHGRRYAGPVVEILRKNVVVDTQFGRYRVPANMLTLEDR